MWEFILDKGVALAVGLTGVIVAARLARTAQRRQFAQQQATQRIDRVRTAYLNATVISRKLITVLTPGKSQDLVGPYAPIRLATVPPLSADLIGETMRLRDGGASDVADALDHVSRTAQRMYDRVAGHSTVIAMAEVRWHFDRCEDLKFAINRAEGYWTDWLNRQERAAAPRRHTWWPWRNRVATINVQLAPGKPPEVSVTDQPISKGEQPAAS
jgi:hypothetical protein